MNGFIQSKVVRRAVVVCSVLYLLSVGLLTGMSLYYAEEKTTSALDRGIEDVSGTLDDIINVILKKVGQAIVARLGAPKAYPFEEMVRLAREYGIDEINVVDVNGNILGTNDRDVVEQHINMKMSDKTRPFMVLATNNTLRVCQKFRAHSHNKNIVRKYVGVPFDKDGFVQIGYDVKRVSKGFWIDLKDIFVNWTIGDDGYYFGYYDGQDRILMQSTDRAGMVGRKVSEVIDWNVDKIKSMAGRRFVARICGELSDCRLYTLDNVVVVAVVPYSEFKLPALAESAVFALVLLVFFALFVWVLWRINGDREKILRMRAAQDRRDAEDLATARSIQKSSLPARFPPFPRDLNMDIFATVDPARGVGGDFYDFYYVGTNRLAIVVADVSGKGVPAAMFMMRAKGILKSCILAINDLAEAVAETNARLCESNTAEMFVTCWVGVLNELTGEMVYVNAGHNPPYIRRADGGVDQLRGVSGLFLAGMDGVVYKEFSTRLGRDDQLFIYTDGVTEANDSKGTMFEEKRLANVLSSLSGHESPREVCETVRSRLDEFSAGTAQFDDITMLSLRYRGQPQVSEITRPATIDFVATLSEFVEKILDKSKCPGKTKMHLLVALDEIVNNVVSYSKSVEITLRVEIARHPDVARITVIDSGTPWNPLAHVDPDITLSVEDRPVGGLGIMLTKKLSDDVSYAYRDGRNHLAFRLAFRSGPPTVEKGDAI